MTKRFAISRLSKNILYNFVGQSALALLGLVSVKYIYKSLGEDALGIIYFNLALNGTLVVLLELGISSTTVREISVHGTSAPYIRDLIRTASAFCWGAYCLLIVLTYFGAPTLVSTWIHLKTLDPATATHALRWLGAGALTALPRTLYSSVFRGLQRMEINTGIDIASSCVMQCGTIAVIANHGRLIHVAIWFFISFGLTIAAYIVACARFLPLSALVPGYSAEAVRQNSRFALHMLTVSVSSIVYLQMDKLVVSKLLPLGTFGSYGFAGGLVARVTMVTSAITQAAFPAFAAGTRSAGNAEMVAQYRKLQDFVCIVTLPLFAGVCFAALPLFTYVFNAATAASLMWSVVWLSLGYYLNATMNIPYIFSVAVGKPEIAAKSNLLALLVVPPATVLLVLKCGLAGAGFSLVFYHLVTCVYLIPRISSECVRIPTIEWFARLGRLLGLAVVTYGAAWLVMAMTHQYAVMALLTGYVVASILFLAGAFFIADPELRRSARLFLR